MFKNQNPNREVASYALAVSSADPNVPTQIRSPPFALPLCEMDACGQLVDNGADVAGG